MQNHQYYNDSKHINKIHTENISTNFIKKSFSESDLIDFSFRKSTQESQENQKPDSLKKLEEEVLTLQVRKLTLEKEMQELISIGSSMSGCESESRVSGIASICKSSNKKSKSLITPQESFIVGILVAILIIGFISYTGALGLNRRSKITIGIGKVGSPIKRYSNGLYGDNLSDGTPINLPQNPSKSIVNQRNKIVPKPNQPNFILGDESNIQFPPEINNLLFYLFSQEGSSDLKALIEKGKETVKSSSSSSFSSRRVKKLLTAFKMKTFANEESKE